MTIGEIYIIKVYPIKYKKEISECSQKYDIDESLIYAIIKSESSFYPNRESKAGACGLMQIMPNTMKYIKGDSKLDKDKLFEPSFNIEVGTKYLRYLFNKFKKTELVICAYNAGEGNIKKWLNDTRYSLDGETLIDIPFLETRKYLKKVLGSEKIYKKLLQRNK